jgi:hypothetical protein
MCAEHWLKKVRKIKILEEKHVPPLHFYYSPMFIDQKLKPTLRNDKPATNFLNRGTTTWSAVSGIHISGRVKERNDKCSDKKRQNPRLYNCVSTTDGPCHGSCN